MFVRDILLGPTIFILVRRVNQLVRIEVTSKIIADEVPIDLERPNQTRENIRITKRPLLNLITNLYQHVQKGIYLLEFRVHCHPSIHVTMSEIVDILSEMAE